MTTSSQYQHCSNRGSYITVKVVLAVLDALNDIPLLTPTFELLVLPTQSGFVTCIKASSRQELAEEQSLRDKWLAVNNSQNPGLIPNRSGRVGNAHH